VPEVAAAVEHGGFPGVRSAGERLQSAGESLDVPGWTIPQGGGGPDGREKAEYLSTVGHRVGG
jgi:hypothetical protein